MKTLSIVLSVLLFQPFYVQSAEAPRQSILGQKCEACTPGPEFKDKISQALVTTTASNMMSVRRKSANGTLNHSDLILAASNVDLLFKHFDEVKGSDNRSYAQHMEAGLLGSKDLIVNYVGNTDDAQTLSKKMAAAGVLFSSNEALSFLQRSPKEREAAYDSFQKNGGVHGLRNQMIHQLHLMDKQLAARANAPRPRLAQFEDDNSFGGAPIPSPGIFPGLDPFGNPFGNIFGWGYDANEWATLDLIMPDPSNPNSGDIPTCQALAVAIDILTICCLLVPGLDAPCCVALILATGFDIPCHIPGLGGS